MQDEECTIEIVSGYEIEQLVSARNMLEFDTRNPCTIFKVKSFEYSDHMIIIKLKINYYVNLQTSAKDILSVGK